MGDGSGAEVVPHVDTASDSTFAELATWEERLGGLEGDTELKLSSKESPGM